MFLIILVLIVSTSSPERIMMKVGGLPMTLP